VDLALPPLAPCPPPAPRRRASGRMPRATDRCRFSVTGLLPECDDEDLLAYFGTFGRVVSASVIRERETLLSRCIGNVRMAEAAAAQEVVDKKGHCIWDREIQVERQEGEDTSGAAPGEPDASAERTIGPQEDGEPGWFFVGKLQEETVEDDVKVYFEQFGEVAKVLVLKDKDGVSKKCAFVKMGDPTLVDDILAGEHQLDGKKIICKMYTKPPDKSQEAKGRGKGAGKQEFGGKGGSFGNARGGGGMYQPRGAPPPTHGAPVGGYGPPRGGSYGPAGGAYGGQPPPPPGGPPGYSPYGAAASPYQAADGKGGAGAVGASARSVYGGGRPGKGGSAGTRGSAYGAAYGGGADKEVGGAYVTDAEETQSPYGRPSPYGARARGSPY